jgi:hypothetical protein
MPQQTRVMQNVLGTSTTLDEAFLERMREVVDPPADELAVELCEGGAYKIFADLIRKHRVWEDDGSPSAMLPESLRKYLTLSSTLPPWIKPKMIEDAEEFFLLYGISSATQLSCASLPECYMMQHGTEVLAFTKFLQLDPGRRIRETAMMVMNVMCPGGLMPKGRVGIGVHATQKVRVMHAIIRHMIEHDPGAAANPTDPELRRKFGRPINQEDLAFTLLTFSYVAVRSYGKLGVPMPEAHKNAYVHCWNVVGYLMGIREDLLPADYRESETLYEAIMEHQGGESPAGQALTAALMNLLKTLMPPGARHLPVILTRYLVGSQNAEMLGLTKGPFRDRVQFWCMLRLWRGVVLLSTPIKGGRPYRFASEWLHRRLMDRMGQLPGSATFRIPPEFLERWFPDRARDGSLPTTVKS